MLLLKPMLSNFYAKNSWNTAPEDFRMYKALLMINTLSSQSPNSGMERIHNHSQHGDNI